MSQKITREQAQYKVEVQQCKQLLNDALRNWVELVQRLRAIDNSGLWKKGPESEGWSHFGDFLRHEFPSALGWERYKNAVALLETYGEDFARIVGIDVAHVLCGHVLAAHPEKREQVRAAIVAHHQDTGVGPKPEVVRAWVARTIADVAPPKVPRRIASIEEARALRAENAALKGSKRAAEKLEDKVKRLETELAKARKQIKELRTRLKAKRVA